jgi:hypothetical protein
LPDANRLGAVVAVGSIDQPSIDLPAALLADALQLVLLDSRSNTKIVATLGGTIGMGRRAGSTRTAAPVRVPPPWAIA